MNIADMHIMFRQLAQQMGMQNVRAILPEQIDLLLNTAITDVINEIIKRNIAGTNDRVITDNSKIGQINALSTLYKVRECTFVRADDVDSLQTFELKTDKTYTTIYQKGINLNDLLAKIVMNDGDYSYELEKETDFYGSESKYVTIEDYMYNITRQKPKLVKDYMFIVDFSLSYQSNNIETDYFPIRLIDDIYLADVLNDFILCPSFRSPIAVINNKNNNSNLDLYFERKRGTGFKVGNELKPYKLRISYVSTPSRVAYLEDVQDSSKNIDCDLPEYIHGDIVKRAVDLYHASLSGSLLSAQAQERAQQQEAMRNNYRQGDNSQAAQ